MTGIVAEAEALRYTPAGVPLLSLRIRHESQQVEAGVTRRVNVEMAAVAMGEIAQSIRALTGGDPISAEGFLARKSPQSNQIVLHICSLKTV